MPSRSSVPTSRSGERVQLVSGLPERTGNEEQRRQPGDERSQAMGWHEYGTLRGQREAAEAVRIEGRAMTYDIERGGPVTDWKNDVGKGWHSLLDELHAELVKVAPEYRTEQVKEKFAALRVYLSPWTDEAEEIVFRFEARSKTICEQC